MIRVLSPLISARIAAGEVVDRPSSVLRELIDNSIDAGADDIVVTIENGGIDFISVSDNGSGISFDDLGNIAKSHATGKISREEDLYNIRTLGFRGEALHSIQSVSKLTIQTSCEGRRATLVIDNGYREQVRKTGPETGTIITVEDLFLSVPARRKFLKRPSSEAASCKNILFSKAPAFPSIRFTFISDGVTKLSWPPCSDYRERAVMLYRTMGIPENDIFLIEKECDHFRISAVLVSQDHFRSDRREIRIYVNGRPVDEFSLQQSVSYGYGELLPGGAYPYAIVFIEDEPEYVDFNIHPAKKEVKIRNISEVHHSLTSLIKEGMERVIPHVSFSGSNTLFYSPLVQRTWDSFHEKSPSYYEKPESKDYMNESETDSSAPDSFRYIGQAFKLFLIAEKDGNIVFVDQHAAHERILYDEIIKPKEIQELLIPIKLETDYETGEFLEKHSSEYGKLGIMIEKSGDDWEIKTIPASMRSVEKEIVKFIESYRLDIEGLESKLFAVIACRAAIKAGDYVDRYTAEALLRKVFALDEPCCPHGRTFIAVVSEKELRSLVGRTD